MNAAFSHLKLSDLKDLSDNIIRRPTGTRPVLQSIEKDGIRAVVKNYSVNGPIFRNTIGRFLVWREEKAYRRLRGLKGVPRLYAVVEGLALVLEEIPGKSVEGLEDESRLPERFFKDLRTVVDGFHERGLAHCDLKRAPNVLVGEHGEPYVVDWSAALGRHECRIFPLNLVYRRFVRDDLHALVKLQLKHCPEVITAEEKIGYQRRGRMESLVRAIRDALRSWLQRIT